MPPFQIIFEKAYLTCKTFEVEIRVILILRYEGSEAPSGLPLLPSSLAQQGRLYESSTPSSTSPTGIVDLKLLN